MPYLNTVHVACEESDAILGISLIGGRHSIYPIPYASMPYIETDKNAAP